MRQSIIYFAGLALVAALFTWSWAGSASQPAIVLYDGALGTLPAAQEFLYLTDPFGTAQATQSFHNGATTLDTTAVTGDKAGYFVWRENNAAVPVLDRAQGFDLAFTMQVVAENHAGSDKDEDGIGDRAGVSVILLGSDKQGIEIAFWEDEIWAQEGGAERPPSGERFTHAEGVAFDTTTGLIAYQLSIITDTYKLTADGVPILSGAVRDYTAEAAFPYTTADFVFLGDDTSVADGVMVLSYAAILGDVVVPTPTGSPTAVATHTPTATATSTPTPTPTPMPTATPTQPPDRHIMLPLITKP